jgi:hypothetical protein
MWCLQQRVKIVHFGGVRTQASCRAFFVRRAPLCGCIYEGVLHVSDSMFQGMIFAVDAFARWANCWKKIVVTYTRGKTSCIWLSCQCHFDL